MMGAALIYECPADGTRWAFSLPGFYFCGEKGCHATLRRAIEADSKPQGKFVVGTDPFEMQRRLKAAKVDGKVP